ncbi:MBL fold metallo-hydrolase [Haliangium sp.]|uniref:MBL fold metallo-hydrolase n=1 Tax=Haliangium sp. TaxID=2663208 RepID=UPI003D0D0E04
MSRFGMHLSRPLGLAAALLMAAGLAACEGDTGPAGPVGPEGPRGEPGQSGAIDQSLSAVDKAFVGVGGKAAVDALDSFTIESKGNRLILSEGRSAGDSSNDVSTFDLTVNYDVAGDKLRLDYTDRTFFFPFAGSRAYSEIIAGNLGYVEGVDNMFFPPPADGDPQPQAAMTSDRVAAIRNEVGLLNPQLLLKAISADGSIASESGFAILDGSVHELVQVDDPVAPITLFVNAATGQISKLETVTSDPLLRDVSLEVFFLDWRGEAGAVRFPYSVFIAVDGELVHAETRESVTVNGAIDATLLAIPASLDPAPAFVQADADRGARHPQYLLQFASIGIRAEGLQNQVVAVPLDNADAAQASVFHLTGAVHHSLAIKQTSGLVIVEAPLYPERGEAILDWAETQFPNTPVTHVISTHHHVDHAGGLRAFVAAGATVVLGAESEGFFSDIFRAPSTVIPDALEGTPTAAKLDTVRIGESLTIDDANFPVVAHHISSEHADDMLMIQVDSTTGDKYLFTSDIFSPGNPANFQVGNGPSETLDAINTLGLSVDVIVGGHGAPGGGPLSELENLVNPPLQ